MEIREALEEKYDALEAETDGAAPVPDTAIPPPTDAEPAPSTEEVEPSAEQRARDESGKFTKVEKIAEAPKAVKPGAAKALAAVPVKAPAGAVPPVLAGAPVAPAIKPPQSWKPAARESWSKIPADIQAEIARVDRETVKAIQENSRLKQQVSQGDPLAELVKPYEGAIRAQGLEPKAYTAQVLQTAHVVFNGPPQTRANALADLIVTAGIDPAILDQALVARMQGRQAPQGQPQAQPQYRDPRVDQLFQTLEQAKAQKEQAAQTEAADRAGTFLESHDFGNDVADDVANILDVWARQGKTSVSNEDLERAYSIACQMNPDVAPLLEQRKAAEAAKKAMASTARARTAASSPRSQTTAAPSAARGLRAVLEDKADELGIE
jgi:hypothetical protein